ncbi:hypothetical protein AWC38_SpisGene2311 [Stylophora pistillata]|uniref:Reverse transcriptase domain-containing protein n=1 Tax=Stylophora pistillata TaxID=50429 RepID=A0A2B4SWA6_STYPI|nr:hypothetical protein AWC38_SpisGene2311 [Stylophora pistillata]
MDGHTRKISRLLYKGNTDIIEHIKNISSHELSFLQKLALSRGLDFALPQRVSSKEIQVAFEKGFLEIRTEVERSQQRTTEQLLHVTSLFTNVPVDETIAILAEKAFQDDWFNKEHNLSITKVELVELLNIATKHQLFQQFEGNLYEQIDGVAMGSPLGPLMANAFMCSIEDRLEEQGKMPELYKHYVDNTLSIMADTETAEKFLATLNESHPLVSTFHHGTDRERQIVFSGN